MEKIPETLKKVQELCLAEYTYDNVTLKFNPELTLVKIPEEIHTLEDLLMITDVPYKAPSVPGSLSKIKLVDYERRIAVEKAMVSALQQDRFTVAYQPIWHQNGNRIACAEALCRLNDPLLGPISPEEFIPLAENSGLFIPIGALVLQKACAFYKENSLQDLGVDFIEVNLSVVQCMHKGIAEDLYNIVKANKLEPKRICFEITESAAINSPETMEDTLKKLSSYGFSFALDDFGTGYSNLSYIFHMPFAIIKIDKSILYAAQASKEAHGALTSIISIMKNMGFEALCEGAETEEQVSLLVTGGIDAIQGYYFSKGLTPEDFLKYVNGFDSHKDFPFLKKAE